MTCIACNISTTATKGGFAAGARCTSIVAHMGVTIGRSVGAASAKSHEQCVEEIDLISEAAMRILPEIILLCHGGPIAAPDDAQFMLCACRNCHGFHGASSMARLPVEIALTEQARKFESIRILVDVRRPNADPAYAPARPTVSWHSSSSNDKVIEAPAISSEVT